MHACVWNSFMEREARRMLPCLMSARLEGYECYTVCSVALRAGSTLIVPRGSRAIRESRVDRVPTRPSRSRSAASRECQSRFLSNQFLRVFLFFKYIYFFYFFNLTVSFYFSISWFFFLFIYMYIYIFLNVNRDCILEKYSFVFLLLLFFFFFFIGEEVTIILPVSDSDKINNF